MTDNKDLKYTQQFKELNIPKTYEQFILEEKDLVQQDLYPDLDFEDIGSSKGYGPCHSCGNKNLKFKLKISLKNCTGGEKGGTVYSTDEAYRAANEIRSGTGHWKGNWKTGAFSQDDREILANSIISEVDIHKNGNNVDKTVCNKEY